MKSPFPFKKRPAPQPHPPANNDVLSAIGAWAVVNNNGNGYVGRVIERLDADTFTVLSINPTTGEPGQLGFVSAADLKDANKVTLFAHREVWAAHVSAIIERSQRLAEQQPASDNSFGCRPNMVPA
ncbi:hypothetical protein [Rhizobium sp. IMFF44]|uniref:hypothetical protein n=1 Tax=Rhizobium sp. IMFF44 TaxID=3342350 RepID=UPI0035B90603